MDATTSGASTVHSFSALCCTATVVVGPDARWYAVDGGGQALLEVMLSREVDINAKSTWVTLFPSAYAYVITHALVHTGFVSTGNQLC